MRTFWQSILAAAVLGALAAPAQATCYFVLDRNDNTIYRGQQPPVDMSERGAAERDAMRARREYLMYVETDNCAPLQFVIGPGTPGTLSVDAIVAGIPTMAQSDGRAAAQGLTAPSSKGSTGGSTSRASSNAAKQSYQAPRR